MRILLFLATNLAVLVLVSIIFNLLGLEGILTNNGVDLNLSSLLVFCGLFGMSGSLISLLLSKFMAKRGTPVTKIADGDVAATAAAEVWEAEPEAEVEAKESPPIKPLDGITDEQALRIREAVRKNKQRRRIEKQAERASEDE